MGLAMIRILFIMAILARGCECEPALAARGYHSPKIHTVTRSIPWTANNVYNYRLQGVEPTGETYIIKKAD